MMRAKANSLVKALATGEPNAFGALYDRFGRSMLRVASVMLRGSSEAEDAVQDVFVEIARRSEQLKYVQNLDAYVFAMLRNNVTRRIVDRQRELKHLCQMPSPGTSEQPSLLRDDLNRALASLPDNQREVIALKIDGDLTFAEIAEMLSVNPNTAASRYRYAIEKLRAALE